MVIGYDLDLDVTRAGYQFFHENGWIAKRLERLSASALKCFLEFIRRMNAANAVTTATRRGFDEQRISQALGVTPGVAQGFDRPAAPRGNRNLCLLSQELRRNLVAQPPHDVAIRTDE